MSRKKVELLASHNSVLNRLKSGKSISLDNRFARVKQEVFWYINHSFHFLGRLEGKNRFFVKKPGLFVIVKLKVLSNLENSPVLPQKSKWCEMVHWKRVLWGKRFKVFIQHSFNTKTIKNLTSSYFWNT